jgi:hypothetical protein
MQARSVRAEGGTFRAARELLGRIVVAMRRKSGPQRTKGFTLPSMTATRAERQSRGSSVVGDEAAVAHLAAESDDQRDKETGRER